MPRAYHVRCGCCCDLRAAACDLCGFVFLVFLFFLAPCSTIVPLQALVAGFQGLMNLTVLWLGMPLLSASGFEPFAWPDPAQLQTLAIGATLAAVGNVTLLVALALLPNPLIVSVGTLLTTPVNYAVDLVLHSDAARSVGALDLAGAAMVVASFAVVIARDFALVGRARAPSG